MCLLKWGHPFSGITKRARVARSFSHHHQHKGDVPKDVRSPLTTPQGEPLQKATGDPHAEGREIGAGLACRWPRTRPQNGSQTQNQAAGDTAAHRHPQLIAILILANSFHLFLLQFLSELRKVGKIKDT